MPDITVQTNHGAFRLTLDADSAPTTVENFLSYARSGFYDSTLFHRVIPGFVIQGGGMTSGMAGKPTEAPITNEADNGLKNERGTICMARTNDPHSATSQFFVNLADNEFLDHKGKTPDGWGYCVFGRVSDGMDVVDTIAETPTTRHGPHADVPAEEVVIEHMTVE